ncbi:MAG TPA: acetyltransferase [Ottowia sp.]|uniref:acetyltransferase n=1 Tax=Ottowia sp. TaxID=1898956 RepID=UPI002C5C1FC7|nr:acetyltransferase [Ottowia sp.]HMN19808.1 acetyltransferase [Ottowia sp.]
MPALLTGTAAALALVVYTLLLFALLAPLVLLKLLARPLPPIAPLDRAVMAISDTWNRLNLAGLQRINRTRWQVRLPDGLQRQAWYLVIANHQSWVDILVLQRCLQGRAPFLKFFIKRELIWVPLVGLAWWALDFPFLRRGGASGRQDLAATRAACARFRALPTSVMSFIEGTRLTPAKHAAQDSPYRHLLRPKAGGVMMALDVLGDRLDAVLDVTIVYPGRVPSFIDALCGRLHEVRVHIERRPVPTADGDAPLNATTVQAWLAELWQLKDERFERLASGEDSSPT